MAVDDKERNPDTIGDGRQLLTRCSDRAHSFPAPLVPDKKAGVPSSVVLSIWRIFDGGVIDCRRICRWHLSVFSPTRVVVCFNV